MDLDGLYPFAIGSKQHDGNISVIRLGVHREENETGWQSAAREVYEEASLHIEPLFPQTTYLADWDALETVIQEKKLMHPKFIFDLSEVLIFGLFGVEKNLSALLPLPESELLKCFAGNLLEEICRGEISEDDYLQQILLNQGWQVSAETLKKSIRDNFQREVEGTRPILLHLAQKYEVVLLSDHAREWVTYIQSIHPFLCKFKRTFFSCELGTTKKNPETFEKVLELMSWQANECWLIDDSAENIRVAASVGINGIQFKNAEQLQEQLVSQALW